MRVVGMCERDCESVREIVNRDWVVRVVDMCERDCRSVREIVGV